MKILVATDGSPFALNAFARACALARTESGSSVTVLAVTPLPMLELLTQRPPFLGEEVLTVQIHKQLEVQARGWVDSTIASQPGEGFTVDSRMVMGHPGEVICDTAQEGAYTLVVVGSRGESKIRRLVLGSVTDYVVHHSPCDVWVVRS